MSYSLSFQALEEYGMIEDGDRVLVCLSGGKDSLSLLHTLRQYQFMAKSKVRCTDSRGRMIPYSVGRGF